MASPSPEKGQKSNLGLLSGCPLGLGIAWRVSRTGAFALAAVTLDLDRPPGVSLTASHRVGDGHGLDVAWPLPPRCRGDRCGRADQADLEFRERLVKTGQTPGGSTIEAVNASMENEVKKWAEVIAKAGIALQ